MHSFAKMADISNSFIGSQCRHVKSDICLKMFFNSIGRVDKSDGMDLMDEKL